MTGYGQFCWLPQGDRMTLFGIAGDLAGELLDSEIAAWERQRNGSGDRIKWMFTAEKACTKMGHAYPKITRAETPAKESLSLC